MNYTPGKFVDVAPCVSNSPTTQSRFWFWLQLHYKWSFNGQIFLVWTSNNFNYRRIFRNVNLILNNDERFIHSLIQQPSKVSKTILILVCHWKFSSRRKEGWFMLAICLFSRKSDIFFDIPLRSINYMQYKLKLHIESDQNSAFRFVVKFVVKKKNIHHDGA